MKSEPDVFSLEDLRNRPDQREPWTGVRNYQARNFMRDEMKAGDIVLFYHSNCKEPGVVGLAKVVTEKAYPDPTQFDPDSGYHDPKATQEKPRWMLVDVEYVATFQQPVTLKEIKADAKLAEMKVAMKGQRLSIQPVEKKHYDRVVKLGKPD